METKAMKTAEIEEKVSYAVRNAEKLSYEELKAVLLQTQEFIKTLPQKERGAFFWNCSGLECLSMLVSALENERT